MKKSRLAIQCSQWRNALIEKLKLTGDWCGHAGPYHLDCKEPRGAWHHITGSYQRIKFYEREARDGNLQVLCIPCHNNKCREEAAVRRHAREHQQDKHVRQWALLMMQQLAANYRDETPQ